MSVNPLVLVRYVLIINSLGTSRESRQFPVFLKHLVLDPLFFEIGSMLMADG